MQIPYEVSLPIAPEAKLYFLAIALMNREVGREVLNDIGNTVNNTLTGMAVKLVQTDSDALMKACSLGPLRAEIQPYMWFNPAVIQFQVISQLSDVSV